MSKPKLLNREVVVGARAKTRITRNRKAVKGNSDPDPDYIRTEMCDASNGLTWGNEPFEWPLWLELDQMPEEEDREAGIETTEKAEIRKPQWRENS